MISFFTSRERKVILFLSLLFLVGNGIRIYKRTFSSEDVGILDLGSLEPADSAEVARLLESSLELRRQREKVKEVKFPLDINKAEEWELMALPGIGKTLAGRIIAYRENIESFHTIEDVKKVKGIGNVRLKELEPFLEFNDLQNQEEP